jgi:hypothetical protein
MQVRVVTTPEAGLWLTKDRLLDYYFKLEEIMHCGSLSKRSQTATGFSPRSIKHMRDLTLRLLNFHVITLADPRYWLIVELNEANEKPRINFGTK